MRKQSRLTLSLAALTDLLVGDPPNRFHPVAWMGILITALRNLAGGNNPAEQFRSGFFISAAGAGITAGFGRVIEWLSGKLPSPLDTLIEALALKAVFSLGSLDRAAGEIQEDLQGGNLEGARQSARRHLVSRDTADLDEGLVAAAAIESIAENTSDGVIAPLFYYALGGLPLAYLYRYINTADAMLGYRDPAREWLGKFPARLDDVLNFFPARLTALLISAAGGLITRRGRAALRTIPRDARKTASPNAGYPMSAMAGALGVELEKVGHYLLGNGNRSPRGEDIGTARKILAAACGLGLFLLLIPIKNKP